MDGYVKQDGCWNCTTSEKIIEDGDWPFHICTGDGLKRPQCGSVCMHEEFFKCDCKTRQAYKKATEVAMELQRIWDAYKKEHLVDEFGKCPKWKVAQLNTEDS